MKKISFLLLAIVLVTFISSCKKEKNSSSDKVSDIIPLEYRKDLMQLGMTIHDGSTPPDVSGSVYMSPNLLLKSNITGDPAPNTQFVHFTIKFYDLNKSDHSLKVSGVGSGGSSTEREESLTATVTGSGNNFTVYGKSTVTVGSKSVIIANVYSGTIDGNVIKNFKKALVIVDDSKGGAELLKNGQMRIFYDGNSKSEFTR